MFAIKSRAIEFRRLPALRTLAMRCAFVAALLLPGSLVILLAWSLVKRRAAAGTRSPHAASRFRCFPLHVHHERKNP